MPLRGLGLLCLLPLALPPQTAPTRGFNLTALDVGQGLAVVVRTAHHTLLFDTGPAYEEGFDAGRAVVVPYLLGQGLRQLDTLLVSHGDLDHRGGAPAVRAALHPRQERGAMAGTPCAAGQTWEWDGVRFDMLHPTRASYDDASIKDNNRGCVLRIATRRGAALIPADIEARAEQQLLQVYEIAIRAMREGRRPDGAHYFPAFPYPSYTRIVDSDLRDLWAYLRSLPPSARANQEHDLKFPFGFRFLLWGWKLLFFTPGPMAANSQPPTPVGRGAYLVNALSHCGECHTPRNFLGGTKKNRFLAGGKGPDGKNIPNLAPTKLKKWSEGELKDFLTTGITADGDVTSESMGEVVTNTLSKITAEDLAAIIAYLRSIPALPDEPR